MSTTPIPAAPPYEGCAPHIGTHQATKRVAGWICYWVRHRPVMNLAATLRSHTTYNVHNAAPVLCTYNTSGGVLLTTCCYHLCPGGKLPVQCVSGYTRGHHRLARCPSIGSCSESIAPAALCAHAHTQNMLTNDHAIGREARRAMRAQIAREPKSSHFRTALASDPKSQFREVFQGIPRKGSSH